MQWMADEHWREEAPDPNARYPRLSPEWNTNNTQANSLYVRNGRMLRLKNAEIGYTYKFMLRLCVGHQPCSPSLRSSIGIPKGIGQRPELPAATHVQPRFPIHLLTLQPFDRS